MKIKLLTNGGFRSDKHDISLVGKVVEARTFGRGHFCVKGSELDCEAFLENTDYYFFKNEAEVVER